MGWGEVEQSLGRKIARGWWGSQQTNGAAADVPSPELPSLWLEKPLRANFITPHPLPTPLPAPRLCGIRNKARKSRIAIIKPHSVSQKQGSGDSEPGQYSSEHWNWCQQAWILALLLAQCDLTQVVLILSTQFAHLNKERTITERWFQSVALESPENLYLKM